MSDHRDATFLFTDIEGSSALWERHPDEMEVALQRHNDITDADISAHEGQVVRFNGDGVFAIFEKPLSAIRAAVGIQRQLVAETWSPFGRLRVRMGIHSGRCRLIRDDVYGPAVNLAARLHEAAHADQILLSGDTVASCWPELGTDLFVTELGPHYFRGFEDAVVVYSVGAEGLRPSFPPLRSGHRGYEELPPETTELIGRGELADSVQRLLGEVRLVTLSGPGGVGKTSLAMHVAHRARRLADGIRYVDLAVVENAAAATNAVLTALRGQRFVREDETEAVVRTLRSAELLLVLDNCEHVLAAVRELVLGVVTQCPNVRCLVTSREPLRVPHEHRLAVPSLAPPMPRDLGRVAVATSPAVELFVERARAIDPGFDLTDRNSAQVAAICRAVDGLPLAVELAAARLDIETLQGLATGTDRLLDRLDGGSSGRGVVSVKDSLSWAYRRLDLRAQRLFRTLGVFAGPFTRAMAARVDVEADRALAEAAFDQVVRSGLVAVDRAAADRYRLLELSKAYVRDLLGLEAKELECRHSELMITRAEEFGPLMRTEREAEAIRTLRDDIADHRAAATRLLDIGDIDGASRLLSSCTEFYLFQLVSEGYAFGRTLASRINPEHPLAARVFGLAALGSWFSGDLDDAVALGLRAVDAASDGDPLDAAWARIALVDAFGYAGRFDELVPHYLAMVQSSRASSEPFWQVSGFADEAISLAMFGQYGAARDRAERAVQIARRLGNADCLYWALLSMGTALEHTDPRAAADAMHAAMDAAAIVDSRWNIALALQGWVDLQVTLNEPANAADGARDLVSFIITSGNRSQLSQVLRSVSRVLAAAGHHEFAATVHLARRGWPSMPSSRQHENADVAFEAELAAHLGLHWDDGEMQSRALPVDELLQRCRRELDVIQPSDWVNS